MRPNRTNWTYRRFDHEFGIETSEWLGPSSPALSAHFHDETQISIVYAGRRFFQIGHESFHIPAGQFAVIPAGTPHRARGLGGIPTMSRDIFIDTAHLSTSDQSKILVGSLSDVRCLDDGASIEQILQKVISNNVGEQKLTFEKSLPDSVVKLVRESVLPIAEVAVSASMSREGFIRRFAREMGMTPHAYRLAHRATHARTLLRKHMSPAAVAFECGFADQSHFGRVFRKHFGTTPATYRGAWNS